MPVELEPAVYSPDLWPAAFTVSPAAKSDPTLFPHFLVLNEIWFYLDELNVTIFVSVNWFQQKLQHQCLDLNVYNAVKFWAIYSCFLKVLINGFRQRLVSLSIRSSQNRDASKYQLKYLFFFRRNACSL